MLRCENYLSCIGNPCSILINESNKIVAKISYNQVWFIDYDNITQPELQEIVDSGLEIDIKGAK
jgi:hypothetical protein